jgi:hypothetical protein
MAAGQIMIREASDVVSGNEYVHGELVKIFKTQGEASPAAFDRLL